MQESSLGKSKPARSSRGARGLESRFATCSGVFQTECATTFQREWICVGTLFELESQTIVAKEIAGRSVLLTKDEEQQVHCFYNVCRHRGAKLVDDKQPGCLLAETTDIVCPYHAWRYSRNGELKTSPNMNEVDNFSQEEFGLVAIACKIWNSLIWICFADEPQEFSSNFAKLEKLISSWDISNLDLHSTISYDVDANWKLLFQNYSECYHCPTVHPVLNRLTPYRNSANDFVDGPILGGPMQLSENSESMTSDGVLAGTLLPNLSPDQARTVVYYTVFPSLFISLHPDYVLFHRLNPESPNQTKVFCDFLFHGPTTESNCHRRDLAVQFWDETNRQDWQVCELVQQGMSNAGYVPGPYSNLESLVAAFDRHYLKTFKENS